MRTGWSISEPLRAELEEAHDQARFHAATIPGNTPSDRVWQQYRIDSADIEDGSPNFDHGLIINLLGTLLVMLDSAHDGSEATK